MTKEMTLRRLPSRSRPRAAPADSTPPAQLALALEAAPVPGGARRARARAAPAPAPRPGSPSARPRAPAPPARQPSARPSLPRPLANMALVPCQVLRVAILLSYCSILCNYKAIEMPSHQTYGGSWKFLTFIDLVRPSPPTLCLPCTRCPCVFGGRACVFGLRACALPTATRCSRLPQCARPRPGCPAAVPSEPPIVTGGQMEVGRSQVMGYLQGDTDPLLRGKILQLPKASDDPDHEWPQTHSPLRCFQSTCHRILAATEGHSIL
jgi:hypothetical protein